MRQHKNRDGSPEPMLCMQCNGEGVIPSPSGVDMVCPVCDGEGWIYVDPEYMELDPIYWEDIYPDETFD